MDKFELEGFTFKIDEHGRYVMESVFDKDGNKLQLEDVKYNEKGEIVIDKQQKDDDTTDAETDQN